VRSVKKITGAPGGPEGAGEEVSSPKTGVASPAPPQAIVGKIAIARTSCFMSFLLPFLAADWREGV